jgi:hypothetical protein
MKQNQPLRRDFLRYMGTLAALSAPAMQAAAGEKDKVAFQPIYAKSEKPEKGEPPGDPMNERIGIAIVGLGRIAVEEMLPAFAESKHAKPVALVSGDRAKALKIAHQYNIPDSAILDYKDYDKLAGMPEVQGVYIALPNSMHAEYTVRAARAGKHVLCEKPMANSVTECQQMIDACRKAGKKLMIAYRSQYEPMDRALVKMIRDKKLGALKEFSSVNSQNMGDPQHWRLKRALAGGGALPDVGRGHRQHLVDPGRCALQGSRGILPVHPALPQRLHRQLQHQLCGAQIAVLPPERRRRLGRDGPGLCLPWPEAEGVARGRRQGAGKQHPDRREEPVRGRAGPLRPVRPAEQGCAHAGRGGLAGPAHHRSDLRIGAHPQAGEADSPEQDPRARATTGMIV